MVRKTKSTPPTYSPSLVVSHGEKYCNQTFYTLFDQRRHVKSIPQFRGMRCVGSSNGWLILQSYFTPECYLLDLASSIKIQLPPLVRVKFHLGCLTSNPSDPKCYVVLYSEKKRAILYCKVGATTWREQDLRCEDPEGLIIYEVCEVVSCQRKIYLNFFRGIAVISLRDDTFASVEIYPWRFLDRSLVPEGWYSSDFFLESDGEVLKIVGTRWGSNNYIFRKFDVYRLNLATVEWVKLETLGDRILLLGKSSTSFSTSGLGVKGNRMYFILPQYTQLYVYDMDDGTMTTVQPFPQKYSHSGRVFWVVPNSKLEVITETKTVVESGLVMITKERSSKDLPEELLELILSSLTLGDRIRFRFTCKTWMPLTTPIHSDPLVLQSNLGPRQLPWLLSMQSQKKGVCTFYHPIYCDTFTVDVPELAGALLREAKYGWLLMSREETSVFFFNPLTRETIKLPDLAFPVVSITFTAPPTSTEYKVFALYRSHRDFVGIFFYAKDHDDHGDWEFIMRKNKVEYEFMSADCNPIFHDGVFYCLSTDGKLGTFDPAIENRDLKWQVMTVPQIFPYRKSLDFIKPIWSSIVECGGEILSCFVHCRGKPIQIYKLDRSKKNLNMKWIEVENLGDNVLFHSPAASILVPSGLKGVENKIYFSQFHEESNTFYCFKTGTYLCFKCAYYGGDCKKTCQPENCTWIQFTN